jgi:protein-disulfide isomerase
MHGITQRWWLASAIAWTLCAPASFAADSAGPAAVVNGRTISRSEVDRPIAAKLKALEQQIHALRKSSLDSAIARLLLEEAAAREGISVDEFKRRITEGPVEIPDDEVEREYQENVTTFASISADEGRERIRADLKTRVRMRRYAETVAALRAAADVTVHLAAPPADVRPFRGDPDAPVTVTLFSDFGCSYCRSAQAALRQLRDAYQDEVKLVYRHFPSATGMSFDFARAAVCADEQARFWPFHDAALAAPELSKPQLDAIVSAVGVDRNRFTECLGSDRSRDLVLEDVQEGRRLGVRGTPTAIVNGRTVPAASGFDTLNAAVQAALKGAPRSSESAARQ